MESEYFKNVCECASGTIAMAYPKGKTAPDLITYCPLCGEFFPNPTERMSDEEIAALLICEEKRAQEIKG